MKEEVPLDDTYAILKRVASGEFVFIDYKNGVGPQIEIKYKKGDKTFIHYASHRWAKFSGKYRDFSNITTRIIYLRYYTVVKNSNRPQGVRILTLAYI